MHDIITNAIADILKENSPLLRIAIRQKAKFEGWLKFELAYYLEKNGMGPVYVESGLENGSGRADIAFHRNSQRISVELKTPNTNWKINGVENKTRPITKNIDSVINDVRKHNSEACVISFVLFPLPVKDLSWTPYIDRIISETGVEIKRDTHCKLLEMQVNDVDKCEMLICSFVSKKVEEAVS